MFIYPIYLIILIYLRLVHSSVSTDSKRVSATSNGNGCPQPPTDLHGFQWVLTHEAPMRITADLFGICGKLLTKELIY